MGHSPIRNSSSMVKVAVSLGYSTQRGLTNTRGTNKIHFKNSPTGVFSYEMIEQVCAGVKGLPLTS